MPRRPRAQPSLVTQQPSGGGAESITTADASTARTRAVSSAVGTGGGVSPGAAPAGGGVLADATADPAAVAAPKARCSTCTVPSPSSVAESGPIARTTNPSSISPRASTAVFPVAGAKNTRRSGPPLTPVRRGRGTEGCGAGGGGALTSTAGGRRDRENNGRASTVAASVAAEGPTCATTGACGVATTSAGAAGSGLQTSRASTPAKPSATTTSTRLNRRSMPERITTLC